MLKRITGKQFQESDELADWRVLAFGASAWSRRRPTRRGGAGAQGRRTGRCREPASGRRPAQGGRSRAPPDARAAWTERPRRGPRAENLRGGPRAGPGGRPGGRTGRSTWRSTELAAALEARTLLEFRAMIRPSEDLALYRAEMAEWPGDGELRDWQEHRRDWVKANDACRRDILDRLGSSGPLTSRDLPDTCKEPWASTGWTNKPQRHPAAGVHGAAGRSRDRWTKGQRAAVGLGDTGLPR
jgi:hypothetical protein